MRRANEHEHDGYLHEPESMLRPPPPQDGKAHVPFPLSHRPLLPRRRGAAKYAHCLNTLTLSQANDPVVDRADSPADDAAGQCAIEEPYQASRPGHRVPDEIL